MKFGTEIELNKERKNINKIKTRKSVEREKKMEKREKWKR